jgi:hypothetical protein
MHMFLGFWGVSFMAVAICRIFAGNTSLQMGRKVRYVTATGGLLDGTLRGHINGTTYLCDWDDGSTVCLTSSITVTFVKLTH